MAMTCHAMPYIYSANEWLMLHVMDQDVMAEHSYGIINVSAKCYSNYAHGKR